MARALVANEGWARITRVSIYEKAGSSRGCRISRIPSPRSVFVFFFFQAEDGIRDLYVTGVQTCALPISSRAHSAASPFTFRPPSTIRARSRRESLDEDAAHSSSRRSSRSWTMTKCHGRSEERRVGKECRCRWWPEQEKKKREEQ